MTKKKFWDLRKRQNVSSSSRVPGSGSMNRCTSTSNLSPAAPLNMGGSDASVQSEAHMMMTTVDLHVPPSPPSSRASPSMSSFKPGLLPGLGAFKCKPLNQGIPGHSRATLPTINGLTEDLNRLCSQADPTGAQMMAVDSSAAVTALAQKLVEAERDLAALPGSLARSDSVGLKKLVPATKSEKAGEFSTKLHQIHIERIDEED